MGLSALSSAKASIYEAWREAGISKSELARRMGHTKNEVRRILALGHRTKLDRLEEAAKALGMRFEVGLVPIAAERDTEDEDFRMSGRQSLRTRQ